MYRTNDPPPPEPPEPTTFSERHPRAVRIGRTLVSWSVGFAPFALVVGLYYLGGWFGNSVMGWGVNDIVAGPQRWFIGLGLVLLPFMLSILSVALGRRIRSGWSR